MKIVFEVPIQPVGKERPRFTRSGHAYTPEKTRKYEDYIAHVAGFALAKAGCQKIKGRPFSTSMFFYYAPPKSWTKKKLLELSKKGTLPKATKPDLDNLEKAVLDAMNGVVYDDDARQSESHKKKLWRATGDGLEVCVWTEDEE